MWVRYSSRNSIHTKFPSERRGRTDTERRENSIWQGWSGSRDLTLIASGDLVVHTVPGTWNPESRNHYWKVSRSGRHYAQRMSSQAKATDKWSVLMRYFLCDQCGTICHLMTLSRISWGEKKKFSLIDHTKIKRLCKGISSFFISENSFYYHYGNICIKRAAKVLIHFCFWSLQSKSEYNIMLFWTKCLAVCFQHVVWVATGIFHVSISECNSIMALWFSDIVISNRCMCAGR